ncbi:M56 family metallopeptidase [Serpentinicella alkaliphila]|uniref:Bla regulator protein BlaR1 n=1 Tax=Serpentinicella alkaliphila TaxID=1734049 RepID=A0A4R2TT01_9FIRM|nr:M56 family metallopeptidase [Serpentinicella alkaliphila]QUH25210.1 N-acetylmuramoyl-L-alanine amidase [Serpentinicella alkaliphila]TCQ07020.1 bla regulator protein BlaR1 [Serpentinicella alkaliphila]
MDILEIVFLHVLYSSLTTSIFIIAYFLVKKSYFQRIGPRYHHTLWMILIIRLLIPINIESSISILNLLPQNNLVILETYVEKNLSKTLTAEENALAYRTWDFDKNQETNYELYIEEKPIYDYLSEYDSAEQGESIIAKESSGELIKVSARIWLFGVLLFTLFFGSTLFMFEGKYKMLRIHSTPELQSLVEESRRKLNIRKPIPVYLSDYIGSPCIRGVFNPCIYLPTDISTKTDHTELQYIILHESAHYKRKDLIYNLITFIAVLIHWFNPIIWFAIKYIRHDREIACDAYVMEIIEEEEIIPYGMTIINSAKGFRSNYNKIYSVSFYEASSLLERRIKMIEKFKKGSFKISIVAIIFCIIIGGMVLTNPSGLDNTNLISTNIAVKDDATQGLEQENLLSKKKEEEPNYKDIIKDMLVLIDPGHGGDDYGAVYTIPNFGEVKEKNLSLEISLLLYNMLRESGVNAELTRQEDAGVPLENRIELVNQLNPSLFVSIHNNFGGASESDMLALLYSSTDRDTSIITGERVAQIIHKELINATKNKTSEITEIPNRLKFSGIKIPAVIIEPAYIVNPSDTKNILIEEFRKKVAGSLHDGIIKVLKEMAVDAQELIKQSEEIGPDGKGQWPVPGYNRIATPYGERIHPISKDKVFYTGIQVPAPRGEKIVAFKDGKVVKSEESKEYGKVIKIDHGNGLETLYANASHHNVSVGDEVKEGQKIAEIGSTGYATGNYLHFEVWVNGKQVNPTDYLR